MNNELISYINKYNYQINKIYIDKFWSNINNKDWIYVDDLLIEWIGYNKINGKQKLINLIKENFKEGIDYKIYNYEQLNNIFHSPLGVNENNKEILAYKDKLKYIHNRTTHIILSPKCFKKSLMMIRTEKANQIRDYYVDIEELCLEFNKYLLQNKDIELEKNNKILKEISKNHSVMTENMIISYIGKSVLYLARIGPNEIKFGITNKIEERIKTHHRNFDIFEIIYVTICYNNREIENLLKQYAKDNNKLFSKTINGKNYTELISVDNDFTIDMIINKIKDECDVQYNYTDLQIRYNEINKKYENLYKSNSDLKHNYEILKYRNKELNEENDRLISNMVNLDCEIFKLKDENKELLEQLNKVNIHTVDIINDDNKENIKENIKEDIILDNISNKAGEIKYETKENNKPTKVKKEFKCMRCLECFSTGIILTQHMNRKTPCKDVNEVIEYKCEKCKKIFASQSGLNRHLKNVKYPCDTGKPKKIYKCEKCNKTFEKIGRYKEHINKQTKCDIIYQCNKCNHIFNNILNYTNHINKKKSCI
jgi:uncharacterized C2H2 Zn-finger protein